MPHRVATSPSVVHVQKSAPSRDSDHAAAPQSLIDELEDAITKQNLRQRAAVMRRVTDLFILNGAGSSEDHVAMFDDVMSRLVAAIEEFARAEFGGHDAQTRRERPRAYWLWTMRLRSPGRCFRILNVSMRRPWLRAQRQKVRIISWQYRSAAPSAKRSPTCSSAVETPRLWSKPRHIQAQSSRNSVAQCLSSDLARIGNLHCGSG